MAAYDSQTRKLGTHQGMHWQEVSTRDTSGSNFPNGNIEFKWSLPTDMRCRMDKSFIRARVGVYKRVGGARTQVTAADGVALNMFSGNHMFQSQRFMINNTTISSIGSSIPQVAALMNRQDKNAGWLNSVARSCDNAASDFRVRQRDLCSDDVLDYITFTKQGYGYANVDTVAVALGVCTFSTANPTGGMKIGDRIVIDGTTYTVGTITEGGTLTFTDLAVNIAATPNYSFEILQPIPYALDKDAPRKTNQQELLFKPALGIFDYSNPLSVGTYTLSLTPQQASTYMSKMIEADTAISFGTADGQYEVEIENLRLYVNVYKAQRLSDGEYTIDLTQIQCQTSLVANNSSDQERQISVPPMTQAITVAWQDNRGGGSVLYPESKFTCNLVRGDGDDVCQSLTRYSIDYANLDYPKNSDRVFSAGIDKASVDYLMSLLQTGQASLEAETLQEHRSRGSYYTHAFSRDGSDRSTEATIRYNFASGATFADNVRLLVFAHVVSTIELKVVNNTLVECHARSM